MESLFSCNLNEAAFTIAFGIFFLLYCFLYKYKFNFNCASKSNLPPGPRPWPIIGNLHLLGNLPHHSLAALARKHGSSLLFLRLGSVPTVVVSSPAMAKEFLKTHDLVFANRPNCAHGKYICYDYKDVAFSHYGEYWRQMRKLCTIELLTVKRTESFRFVREEEVSSMIASAWKESAQGARCVNVNTMLSSLTQNITCRMFSGRTYCDNDLDGENSFKQIVGEMATLGGEICIGDFLPFLNWLDLRGIHRRMRRINQTFDRFAENVIDEHIQRRLEKEKPKEGDRRVKDLVDVMLDMAETDGQTISRFNIKPIIMDIIAGGMETSSTLVEWAMSELIKNPSTLARAQQEMDCEVGRKRIIMESDIEKLQYFQCVVKESFRLHPPLPLLIPHESMEGCSVGGYFIPPKTRVYVNVWAIGRDANVWNDAHLFKPERFMGCDKDVKGQDFDLLPFGTGRRGCPGITMGLSVSELALAQLIHCFDWSVEGEVNMEEASGLSVPRKFPLSVRPSWRLTAEYPI